MCVPGLGSTEYLIIHILIIIIIILDMLPGRHPAPVLLLPLCPQWQVLRGLASLPGHPVQQPVVGLVIAGHLEGGDVVTSEAGQGHLGQGSAHSSGRSNSKQSEASTEVGVGGQRQEHLCQSHGCMFSKTVTEVSQPTMYDLQKIGITSLSKLIN